MTTIKQWIPGTTVGRFWGYVGILIALSVSLAGNVAAAYLHDRQPTWVDLGFAGLAPLSAFISIEIVNHNPWQDEMWGKAVKWVLLALVAPAAAIVSFIHLMTVVITGRVHDGSPEGVLNWITAALTALLIDGLMFGGTAALLIKVKAKIEPVETMPHADLGAIIADLQAQIAEMAKVKVPARTPRQPRKPVLTATLGSQTTTDERDRKRWKPREHPLWADWLAARGTEAAWDAQEMVLQMKKHMDREITVPAATTMLGRWEKELATVDPAPATAAP